MAEEKEELKKIKYSDSKKAQKLDSIAKGIINFGGISTIIAVVGILAFVFLESLPIWFKADSELESEIHLTQLIQKQKPLLIGVDDYREILFVVTDAPAVEFINMKNKTVISTILLDNSFENVSAYSKDKKNNFAVANDKGEIILFKVFFNIVFDEKDNRVIKPVVERINLFTLDSLKRNINKIHFTKTNDNSYTILYQIDNELYIHNEEKISNLLGETKVAVVKKKIEIPNKKIISDFITDSNNEKLMVGSKDGMLFYFNIKDKNNIQLIQSIRVTTDKNISVTKLEFLIGDQSLIVSDSRGNVSSWMRVLDNKSDYGWKLVNPHIFQSHPSEVSHITASFRNKAFLTADKKGNIRLDYLTTSRTLLELRGESNEVKDLIFTPKGDGVIALYKNGRIFNFEIDNPHPEVSFKAIFGKIWYEGYDKPEYVWQSTGGTDDFEPKFSLIPLIFGTLKGTFFAMLFAIPIALLGALYTSVFSHPKLKNFIKPTVEIMAALPSVVIGFLAGLWLAPTLEKVFPGVLITFFILPIMIFLGLFLWNKLPLILKFKFKSGYELFFIVPMLLIGIQLALFLGPYVESIFFNGDYRAWLLEVFNEQYDQRNSIVVGFAMGFAVIPIIFTICEDSLSSVPQHLKSASLALGATKWQTAIRVILPTASPGIFSAIMIGFGRAVGETMIVLMATGNTPLLDLSPFNGMRTLSANIAVEIPEAPYLGTLYRILFLSATILFIMTFVVNTAAEIIRQRLRKKYMHI